MVTEVNAAARRVDHYDSKLDKVSKMGERFMIPNFLLAPITGPIKSKRDAAIQDFLQKKSEHENRPPYLAEGEEILTYFPTFDETEKAVKFLQSVGIQMQNVQGKYSKSVGHQVYYIIVEGAYAAQARQELLQFREEEDDHSPESSNGKPKAQPIE